jgi:circadian clock protein KaiB
VTYRRRVFKFRLFVADTTKNSEAARANLAALCSQHLKGRYEIEVVDVLREPVRAMDEGILMTPTLVKFWPLPVRKIVGTLSQIEPLLNALGIERVRS